jgi:hypothetical protein
MATGSVETLAGLDAAETRPPLENHMTRKTTKSNAPARKTKRLSLSKKTLKDLSAPDSGPQGGMGIRIVKTACSHCASCKKK